MTRMELEMEAQISLADADPSAPPLPKHTKSTVTKMHEVTFTPDDVRPRRKQRKENTKEEL
ncbi:unnamed protein product [Darwinula stevensoni]|uniref:Uncharacterized protein n=1 Tax=Darwinula stevensoni TaxID=69355 RepID=A0A7R9A5Y8_9CRUS|nr:unnamed protein product [Darwinula stevensoni]CAG0895489.1 unnamed protein product [Darwinula stevensoni]